VRASIAHATMLHQQKLLTDRDFDAICTGLEALAVGHVSGEWRISLEDEDVHTALERRLTEKIGEAGKRVHLGRSRNDQLLAALRLYLLDAVPELQRDALGVVVAGPVPGEQDHDGALFRGPGAEAAQQRERGEGECGSARASHPRILANRLAHRGAAARARAVEAASTSCGVCLH